MPSGAIKLEETMKLNDLISELDAANLVGDGNVAARGVAIDSRAVSPGDVFVALRGTRTDGHRFLDAAVAAGASALVVEESPRNAGVPVVVVPDTSRALARIASRLHGDPASRLVLCGVTGTNGKSTVAVLTRAIMNETGRGRMGLIGTLGWGVDELGDATHTTPDASILHGLLAGMEGAGAFGVVMEVSSHAVRQHRVWGLDFEVGVITNVTHDHLDYHHTWEDYRDAKAEFCSSLAGEHRRKPDGRLVFWREDEAARGIGEAFPGTRVSVGSDASADAYARDVHADLGGTRMTLHLQSGEEVAVSTRLLGSFVPTNAALAAAAAVELGADAASVRRGLESIERVPGRFEALGGDELPTVIVDYAHTADAMERVLETCRSLGASRVTTVFGCGGDRDREKRPLMGDVASRLSDRCYITTDNPRTEPVEQIIDDILSGVKRRFNVVVEPDRSLAIRQAVSQARPGDVVALLGKGHETYQLIGTEKSHFSDRETAEGALERWSAR